MSETITESKERLELRRNLTGALIGLARAVDSTGKAMDEATRNLMIEGLLASAPNTNLPDEHLEDVLDRLHREKARLAPGCGSCKAPCGRTDDDVASLDDPDEKVHEMKETILYSLRWMAAYVVQAKSLHQDTEEIEDFFCRALFELGNESDPQYLKETVAEAKQMSKKCFELCFGSMI